MKDPNLQTFLNRVEDSSAVVGVLGLGYVGLPLSVEICRGGYRCLGFDISREVVEEVNSGRSHIQDVPHERLAAPVAEGRLRATVDMSRLKECDAISICVPTPLNKIKDPDLSYVIESGRQIKASLRPGQLIVLESTTFPGTTRDVLLGTLEESGLKAGQDFFVCYSPERVDPGNTRWNTRNTPKVIGGLTAACLCAGTALYDRVFDKLMPVSSPEAAELTKVYENTFRMINIALANELAQVCDRLDVDVWEVIEAAASKPFGFMPFTPGPGLGGHCIPLDPHYLSWKMRALSFKTRMIELASEINAEMPGFVVGKVSQALNLESKAVRGSRILIVGVAYKPDIDDLRESPALDIMRQLSDMGGEVRYHDPHISQLEASRYGWTEGRTFNSQDLSARVLADSDAVVIVTNHRRVDYQSILDHASLVVDTRGVTRGLRGPARVVALAGQRRSPRPELASS